MAAISDDPCDTSTSAGLMGSIRSGLAAWVALLKTRIEIISTELEEAKIHLEQMVLLAVAALYCLSFGLLLLTLFVVTWFWETQYRMHVLGGFALLYLGAGIASALILRNKVKNKPKLFGSTVAELSKDHEQLSSKDGQVRINRTAPAA